MLYNQIVMSQDQYKLPPQNIEAEHSLLGSLMIDKNAIIKVVDFLKSNDFYKKNHQDIYSAILTLFERREPIDLLSVSSLLKERGQFESTGGSAYLSELVNSVPTASHVTNYAKIVQKKRVLRNLIESSQEIGSLAYEGSDGEIDSILDFAERKIFSISEHSMSQSFVSVKDSLEETFERIDKLSKFKGSIRGVPTGFDGIDNILSGLQKSDLIILAARPSLGKSSLAFNAALNAAINQKASVGIFSLEMSRDQVVDRFISSIANIDLWRLRTGQLSENGDDNDFQRIQRALSILSETKIYVDDSATSDILQMRAMARRLQADKGLDLLVIDYLQLMDSGRNTYDSMVQQMSQISRSLKGLAKELNIPILALSQLSRAVEQRTPQIPRLSDLRESGCLTGDALVHRSDTGELVPIKNLVGKTDVPIYSLNEEYQIVERKMSRIFSTGKKKTYKLKTKSGYEIKASANHPFWKVNGWTRLDELKTGDHIATPKKLTTKAPKNELSKNEIILLAHLLGDGCILPRQPYHYTSADQENINIVAKTAKSLFNINSRIVKQKNWYHIYLPSPYRLTHGKHHPITEWFNSLGIERVRSFEKKIPQKVFSLDDCNLALFLKHLWATDGHIGFKKLKNRNAIGSIYYATTSKEMANSIKYLLLRFGIRSKINEAKKENYRICYQISITGALHQMTFLKEIGCFGKRGNIIPELIKALEEIEPNTNLDVWPKETWQLMIDPLRENKEMSWRELSSMIQTSYSGSSLFKSGIGTARMERIAQCLQSPIAFNMVEANIFWDEIISIEPLGIEEVYDATVPGLHNFVANGIIVENSIEQDADVVLFIHREDKYRPETSRKNIADIIIAKHRNGPVGKVELFFDEKIASFKNMETNYQDQE